MPRKPYSRKDRFGHEVQKILSDLMLKEIDTTEIGFTTISDVKMSNDLRSARIYVSVLNRKVSVDKIEEYFQTRGRYLRKLLGSELNAKSVPELKFFYDDSFEEVEKIDRLLSETRSKRMR
jgi:ribosome-binding factor A|tara:strand:+ start:1092 stop:1454 length:363 start_codon:yes stop_codon:yes gene_type:complete